MSSQIKFGIAVRMIIPTIGCFFEVGRCWRHGLKGEKTAAPVLSNHHNATSVLILC